MSKPIPRVTQKDVAREAGVSHVTVSLALRGRHGIPVTTQKRIKAIAKRIGYSPDPMLGALSAYRRAQRPAAFHSNLGWINDYPNPEELYGGEDFRLYFQGARERAKELGFGLEAINLVEYGYEGRAIRRVLAARGITGLLIAPVHDYHDHINVDWSRYSSVRFGYSMQDTLLHTVMNSQYRTSYYAVENLIRLGYRRIGYASDENFSIRTGGHFLGGYLSARARFQAEDIPVLNLEPMTTSDDVPYWNQALPWIKRSRPDVILSASGYLVPHLKRWGYQVPADIGLASLAIEENSTAISGMHQNARNVGRAGVNLLISLMERQETGIPKTPMHVLIEGVWRDGETTRKVPLKKVAAKSQTNRPRLK